jgi:hypothetical protein
MSRPAFASHIHCIPLFIGGLQLKKSRLLRTGIKAHADEQV